MYNNWFTVSIEDFLEKESGKYVIPQEYLTKGCKKNITQCIVNHYKAEWELKETLALSLQGNAKYMKDIWGKDDSVRWEIDDVIWRMMEKVRVSYSTRNNLCFIENITRQDWISKKQFIVLSSMVNTRISNPSWENDNDEELSKSYIGLTK